MKLFSRKAFGKNKSYFLHYFPSLGKKGMEMWQLILIILAVLLLLSFLVWYGVLGKQLEELFQKIGDFF
jgi:hypothetical protein